MRYKGSDSASGIGRKFVKHSFCSNYSCYSLIGRVNGHERADDAGQMTPTSRVSSRASQAGENRAQTYEYHTSNLIITAYNVNRSIFNILEV